MRKTKYAPVIWLFCIHKNIFNFICSHFGTFYTFWNPVSSKAISNQVLQVRVQWCCKNVYKHYPLNLRLVVANIIREGEEEIMSEVSNTKSYFVYRLKEVRMREVQTLL